MRSRYSSFVDASFIGVIPLQAASRMPRQPLQPVRQRIVPVTHAIELPSDKPQRDPTARLRDDSSLADNWRSADPVVWRPDGPCPRTV
jgi:hypothetical protein